MSAIGESRHFTWDSRNRVAECPLYALKRSLSYNHLEGLLMTQSSRSELDNRSIGCIATDLLFRIPTPIQKRRNAHCKQ